ncbi:MAG: energy transducer TonB [Flavobacteriales bacterium]|nr:energy transducer TonB [Flavobacteriales bacterium]
MSYYKKNQQKLEKLRGIFFQIGLIVAGGFTLLAFEWTSPNYIPNLPEPPMIAVEDWDYPPIIPEKEKKVEPPKVKQPEFKLPDPDKLVIGEKEPEKEPEKQPEKKQPEFDPGKWKEVEPVDPEPVELPVLIAGVMPHFKECADLKEEERKACTQEKMYEHFSKNTKVPESVKMIGQATYKVYVYFEVNKKGEIVNVQVMDDKKNEIPKELQRVAFNAVKSLPQLNPGKNHGKEVSVKYTVPFKFTVK